MRIRSFPMLNSLFGLSPNEWSSNQNFLELVISKQGYSNFDVEFQAFQRRFFGYFLSNNIPFPKHPKSSREILMSHEVGMRIEKSWKSRSQVRTRNIIPLTENGDKVKASKIYAMNKDSALLKSSFVTKSDPNFRLNSLI